MIIERFDRHKTPDKNTLDNLILFLHTHLEEFGDSQEDIRKAFDYAFSEEQGKGGFILVGYEQNEVIGSVVLNQTGMNGYIPENILVYIATHKDQRGKGFGKQLMQRAIDETEGNIALHVEPNNPALFLYKKLGFENKYLEMRLEK
ncbi:MAG: GNAT family N-acetyltransferase [Bacteroidales bacterium]|nr:GNAT family N-acetyltransferase [Bacteroidales bacterium]